jgi:hypothetical protein
MFEEDILGLELFEFSAFTFMYVIGGSDDFDQRLRVGILEKALQAHRLARDPYNGFQVA